MNFITKLEKQSNLFWVIIGFFLISMLGFLDYFTGLEL